MKKPILSLICIMLTAMISCNEKADTSGGNGGGSGNVAERNLIRAMEIVDSALPGYFTGNTMAMYECWNPYTGGHGKDTPPKLGSVWMYTSAIEATNSIMHGLKIQKDKGNSKLYDQHFNRYAELLSKLYDNLEFYAGTYSLVSYTQTKEWTVYGVNRAEAPGTANVTGRENVYDDQQWLVRELIEAYKLTGDQKYLTKAEYLADYVLDGWDCTLDGSGKEAGGIPWGPGYTSKHSCSNGPMISPVVWLHELYKGKAETVTYGYIDTDKSRKTKTQTKSDYYLDFAKKIYAWQSKYLKRSDNLFHDATWGPNDLPIYENVSGKRYRNSTPMTTYNPGGNPLSYNSGSMISGAADLYRVTKDEAYKTDIKTLSDASFSRFAILGQTTPDYYTYDISGFNNWFNCVLVRGYIDGYSAHNSAAAYIDSFQKNLDYAYDKHRYMGLLPTNLLLGWNRDRGKNDTDGMFEFAFASEYAMLAKYELSKD